MARWLQKYKALLILAERGATPAERKLAKHKAARIRRDHLQSQHHDPLMGRVTGGNSKRFRKDE